MSEDARPDTEVSRAADRANVLGFNPALDALYIERTPRSQCIAWWSSDEGSQMVNRNISYRGRGTWGESRVFTPDRAAEFVDDADSVEIIDKRPFNYIKRSIARQNGLGVGTAWALAFFFKDAERIVTAREPTLKAVPGIGDRKARAIRRAVGHLDAPPEAWSDD